MPTPIMPPPVMPSPIMPSPIMPTQMMPAKFRSIFITLVLATLALALGFGATLSTGSFNKSLTESYISSFVINGGESVRKIEYALKYGKQLGDFFGIETILQEIQSNNPNVKNVRVLLADGRIVNNLAGAGSTHLAGKPFMLLKQMMRPHAKSSAWYLQGKQYGVLIAVHDPAGSAIGAIEIVFDESVISPHTSTFEHNIMMQTLVIGLIAALILLILLLRMQITDPATGNLRTRRVVSVILMVIGLAQITLTTVTIQAFQPVYLATVQRNHQLVGEILQKSLEQVIAKGVTYTELTKVGDWLDPIAGVMPEIETIILASWRSSTPIHNTHSVRGSANMMDLADILPRNLTIVYLAIDSGGTDAQLHIALSQSHIDAKNRDIIINAATLLVITLLFSVEIVLFIDNFFRRQIFAHGNQNTPRNTPQNTPQNTSDQVFPDTNIVRPQAFILFMATSMATSFLPVILKNFDPIPGVPESIFLGLPQIIEISSDIVSTIIAGNVLRRYGWRPPFIAGLITLIMGIFLSGLSSNTQMFLFSRLVVGAGFGFVWMSLCGFVAMSDNQESQSTAMAGLNSGMFAGVNCGIIFGSLMVERLGYSGIFWISLLMVGAAVAFCFAFTTNKVANAASLSPFPKTVGALVAKRDTLLFFLTIVIPSAICLMFLSYFVPNYSKNIGISAGDVGRQFLLYGLCKVYIGPLLSARLDHKLSAKGGIGISFSLILASLILFGFFPNLWTCTFAVMVLGLSDGIGSKAQSNHFMDLASVKQFGVDKSTGVLDIVKKIGQSAGPLVFGGLSLMAMGIGMLGIAFGLGLLIFMLLSFKPKKAGLD